MLEPYVQETFLRAAQQIEMTAQDQRAPHVLMRPRIFPDGNAWCALLGDDLQSGVAGFGDTPAAAAADFDLQWSTAKAPPADGVLAVAAWAHEDDPARVISAAQKAEAERDGGASASSLRPYSVALVRAAAGVAVAPDTSAWWALVMGAAASIEDAANCLRDPDAKKQADGAAKHYREAAQKLMAAAPAHAPLPEHQIMDALRDLWEHESPRWPSGAIDAARRIERLCTAGVLEVPRG